MKIDAKFKTRARLFEQLGEQLIKSESIALIELIKNSYDADASYCQVKMREPWNTESGLITIEDDGEGMDEDTIINAWLELGTDYKSKLGLNKSTNLTKKYKRNRLGEKGIGRFGVHKLGRSIEITTKKSNNREYVVKIDWDKVSETKYIEELPVSIISREPIYFADRTGTRIDISNLKAEWNKRSARECYRVVTSLNSPLDDESKFKAEMSIADCDWLSGLPTAEEILSNSLFSFDVTMKGDHIVDFNYKFEPWQTMDKVDERIVDISNKSIQKTLRMATREGKIDLGEHKIGIIRFKGVIFDLDTPILSLMNIEKSSVKKYLEHNGGVRVYRDSMRVMDYGEPNTDWLGLGTRRVNSPAKKVSNNIILGAVYIDAKDAEDLIEKSNREGFIENEAYYTFRSAVLYALDKVENQRQIDKEEIRKLYRVKSKMEPVVSSATELENLIEKKIVDPNVKKEMFRYINRLRDEYEHVKDVLMKSAGAGLAMFTVLHQVEKIIKELLLLSQNKASYAQLREKIKLFERLVEGYSVIVKKTDFKKQDLNHIVNLSLDSVAFRIVHHGVEIENRIAERSHVFFAKCSQNHVMNAIINIIDNSLWWISYFQIKHKKMFVDIVSAPEGYVSVILADNGCGFSMSPEMMTKPFVSDKPEGTGIGLHLVDILMKAQEGLLIFPEFNDFDIPREYENGAIVQLAFKKE